MLHGICLRQILKKLKITSQFTASIMFINNYLHVVSFLSQNNTVREAGQVALFPFYRL